MPAITLEPFDRYVIESKKNSLSVILSAQIATENFTGKSVRLTKVVFR